MVIALIEITSKYKCNKLRENIALVAVHLDTGFDNFSFGGVPPCETHEKVILYENQGRKEGGKEKIFR